MATTNTKAKPTKAPRWDLESIFPGGSDSKEFAEFQALVKSDLAAARKQIASLPQQLAPENFAAWRDLILEFQRLGLHRSLHPSFHILWRQPHVERAKRNIVFNRRREQLVIGVLENEPDLWMKLA